MYIDHSFAIKNTYTSTIRSIFISNLKGKMKYNNMLIKACKWDLYFS